MIAIDSTDVKSYKQLKELFEADWALRIKDLIFLNEDSLVELFCYTEYTRLFLNVESTWNNELNRLIKLISDEKLQTLEYRR